MNSGIGQWPDCKDGEKLQQWLEKDDKFRDKMIKLAWRLWDSYCSVQAGTQIECPFEDKRWDEFYKWIPWDRLPTDAGEAIRHKFKEGPPIEADGEFCDQVFLSVLRSNLRDERAWKVVIDSLMQPRERAHWECSIGEVSKVTDDAKKQLSKEFPVVRDMRAELQLRVSKIDGSHSLCVSVRGPQTEEALSSIFDDHMTKHTLRALWDAASTIDAERPIRTFSIDDANTPEQIWHALMGELGRESPNVSLLTEIHFDDIVREVILLTFGRDMLDPLGQRLRNALDLIGQVNKQPSDGLRITLCMSAIEMLLVRGRNDPISNVLAQRIPVLLVPSAAHRVQAAKNVRELYNKRSDFVHGRVDVHTKLDESVRQAERLAAGTIIATLLWRSYRPDNGDRPQCEDPKGELNSEEMFFTALESALYTAAPLAGPPVGLSRCLGLG